MWQRVEGQILLGDEEFKERFLNYLKGHEDVKEVPRSQRLIGRPALKELWKDVKEKDKGMRNQKIREVVEMYGYSIKEVAEHVKLHYSTVSRIVSGKRAK